MKPVQALLLPVTLVLILVTDAVTPLGFAHGVFYVVPVGLAYLQGSRRMLLSTVVVAVAMIWLGFWLSSPGMDLPFVLGNRLTSSLIVLGAGGLLAWMLLRDEANQRIQQALSELGLGVFVTDAEGRLTWANEAVAELEGEVPQRVIVPDQDGQSAEIRSVLDGQGRARDLRRRVRAVANADHGAKGYVGLVENVTPGDVWYQTLSEVRVGHAAVLESISDAILAVDASWRVTYVNPAAERLLRHPRAVLLGRELSEVYPGVMQSAIGEVYREAFGSGEFRRVEAHFARIDAWLDVRIFPHPQGVTFIFRDVTEERALRLEMQRAQEESRQQAALLRAVIDGLSECLMVVDTDSRLLLMNEPAEGYLGYFRLDRPPLPFDERVALYLADETTPVAVEDWPLTRALRGETIDEVRVVMRNALHPDGVPLRVSARPLRGEDGAISGAIVWFRDISDVLAAEQTRKEIEEELRHAQRLEAMGQLTGGVAHDFNNLLTVIVGNADLMVGQPELDADLEESARMILAAAEKASRLVQQLLAFSRRQPLAPEAFDPVARLQDFLPLLQRTLGETIELSLQGRERELRALADPTQFESAVLNLCVNARDAMPKGGALRIRVARTQLADDDVDAAAMPPGEYVSVQVEDEGVGMSEEIMERALEPFFTTKDVGHGSGLGLSMVFGFVRQSAGHLRLRSEPGQGTTVEMLLPLLTVAAEDEVGSAEPVATRSRAREQVLVVEDDPMVCDLIRLTLEELGYRPQVARNGEQALERAAGTAIDVLLTDLVLPGPINGLALVATLRRERPGLKVLLMTGHGAEAGLPADADPVLRKPFRRSELAGRLREVLES